MRPAIILSFLSLSTRTARSPPTQTTKRTFDTRKDRILFLDFSSSTTTTLFFLHATQHQSFSNIQLDSLRCIYRKKWI
ncbi:hypothetical protein L1887_07294 [Cichorium endivia]|nr:hypothetical protein L1887_07294 [Cichorium endivia]